MNKKHYIYLLLSLSVGAILLACEDEVEPTYFSLWGTWIRAHTAEENSPVIYRTEYEFKVDSTYTFKQIVSDPSQPMITERYSYLDSGSYRLNGDLLSLYQIRTYYDTVGAATGTPLEDLTLQNTNSMGFEVRVLLNRKKDELTFDYTGTPCPFNALCIDQITFYRD